jgi:hypothetical protein
LVVGVAAGPVSYDVRPLVKGTSMKAQTIMIGSVVSLIGVFAVHAEDAKVDPRILPPPAVGKMDFAKDILPLFERSCLRCHRSGRIRQGGSYSELLRLDMGRDAAMELEGFIVPGKSAESTLIHHVAWLKHPTNGGFIKVPMPPTEKERLSANDIGKLRAWIDQGAVWHGYTPQLPEGYRLVSAYVLEEFPTDGGERLWAEFVKKHERLGPKATLVVSEKRGKMFLSGGPLEPLEKATGWLPYIPPPFPKVHVFIPDLVAAKVEVRIRDVKAQRGGELWTGGKFRLAFDVKPVWSHEQSNSSVLSPEFEVGYDGFPVLDVRIISSKDRTVGVSNIMVIAPAAKK